MKRILTLSLVVLCSTILRGRDVQLTGNAPGGAGKQIQVYSQPDAITGQPVLIKAVQIHDNEKFTFITDCNNICWLRLRYGIYEIILIVEKGRSYEFELPAFKARTAADKLNPFFKYNLVHIRLPGKDNINNRIKYIDSVYFSYTNQYTRSLYLGKPLTGKDSLLRSFSHIGELNTDDYSHKYYEYRYSLLRMILDRQIVPGSDDIKLLNREFLPWMPAYTDFVNQAFKGYLKRLVNNRETSSLRRFINSGGSYQEIIKILKGQEIIKDNALLEYVLLLNLYNEYYNRGFKGEGIDSIFKWMSVNAVNNYNRHLAGNITHKINRLKPGNIPPDFRLTNPEGKIYTLDSLMGKFTILVFGTLELPETKFELDILNTWVTEYEDRLSVVVILLDEDFQSSLERIGKDEYGFIFLDGYESTGLSDEYEIRYLPAFYVIDPNLRLILSPAVLPSENLRSQVVLQFPDSFIDNIRD